MRKCPDLVLGGLPKGGPGSVRRRDGAEAVERGERGWSRLGTLEADESLVRVVGRGWHREGAGDVNFRSRLERAGPLARGQP